MTFISECPPSPRDLDKCLMGVPESSKSGEIMSDTSADAVLRMSEPRAAALLSRMILQVQRGQGSPRVTRLAVYTRARFFSCPLPVFLRDMGIAVPLGRW